MPLLYRDGQFWIDGEAVTQDEIVARRDAMIDQLADDLALLTADALGLARPRTAVEFPLPRIEAFATSFLGRIRDALVSAYTWARGGPQAVTPAEWGTVAELVSTQDTYAAGFVAALQDGTVSEAQAIARARQYAGAATKAFSLGVADQVGFRAPAQPGDGCEGGSACRCWWEIVEHPDRIEGIWHAVGDETSCGTCLDRAARWNPFVQRRNTAWDEA